MKHNDDDVSLVLEFWSHDEAYDVPCLVSKCMKIFNEAVTLQKLKIQKEKEIKVEREREVDERREIEVLT